jgi:hypothetical protein
MKRIGDIAAMLVAHPELMRAALNEPARELRVSRAPSTAANEGGGRAVAREGRYALPPLPSGVEGRPRQMGKGRGTKPRQFTGSAEHRENARDSYGTPMHAALRLVSSRCLDTAITAANLGRSPRPVVSRHLVLVGGRDHASTRLF